jgi:hypothetical protein
VVCKSWPTHTVNRHVKLCTDWRPWRP